jgi:hypothetical protein
VVENGIFWKKMVKSVFWVFDLIYIIRSGGRILLKSTTILSVNSDWNR